MKYFKFPFLLALLIGTCYVLSIPIPAGDATLPPVGKFFSPFSGFWNNAESTGTRKSITINTDKLSGEVEVVFDDRDVPHIFADNIEDAVFVQGYLHARDRLFQMDVAVRAASGQLSEILGESTVKMDRIRRQMGIEFASEKAVDAWSKYPEYKNLSSYSEGANHFINQLKPEDYPVEFKLLGHKPGSWSNLKSSLFQKNMALTLCAGQSDIQATNLLKYFGQETFSELFPEWNPKQSPIIPSTKTWNNTSASISESEELAKSLSYYQKPPIPEHVPGIGSNNWAVAASKTKNGNAILANDPHLKLTLPSIWYEVHINTPEVNVYGVSLPGVPGVIIGFNDNIAWGVTNVGHDVLDWYKIKWLNDEQTIYELDGETKEVEYRIEKIAVKGAPDIIDTIKYTHWGPVLPDDSPWENYQGLSMRWLALDAPDRDELNSFMQMAKGKNHDDYLNALANYILPAQNFAFASVDGDVAIKVNGKLPIKNEQNGRFIKDGSKTANGWKGFIPRNELPADHKPERGFISSANQNSTAPDYPYYYNGRFENYRGRIINDMLEEMENITVDDMMAMHQNSVSYKAKDALPSMINLISNSDLNDDQKEILDKLSKWNYSYDVESAAASYFDDWYEEFYDLTFDEISNLKDSMTVMMPSDWVLVKKLEDNQDDRFFDIQGTTIIENAGDLVRQAFMKMTENFSEKDDHKWTTYNKRRIEHIASIPSFSVNNVQAPGHGDVINAYNTVWGPSWRMIVELDKDKVNAYGVFPGGQSGNPGSPFYKTGIDNWTNGKYFKLNFVKQKEQLDEVKSYSINFSKS